MNVKEVDRDTLPNGCRINRCTVLVQRLTCPEHGETLAFFHDEGDTPPVTLLVSVTEDIPDPWRQIIKPALHLYHAGVISVM